MPSHPRHIPGDVDTSLAAPQFVFPADIEARLAHAEALLESRKTGQGRQIIMKLAVVWNKLQGPSSDQTARLGQALLAIHEHQLAEHFLRQAQRETPETPDFLGSLGVCRWFRNDIDAAMMLFKQSAQMHLIDGHVEGLLADLNNIVACSLSLQQPELARIAILELLEDHICLPLELQHQIDELVESLERCQALAKSNPLCN